MKTIKGLFVHLFACTCLLRGESETLALLERSKSALPTNADIRKAHLVDGDSISILKDVLRRPEAKDLWPSALYSLVLLTAATPGHERSTTASLLAGLSTSKEAAVCLKIAEYADPDACALVRRDAHNFEWTIQTMSRIAPRALGLLLKEAKSSDKLAVDTLRRIVQDPTTDMEGRLEAIAVLMRDGSDIARSALKVLVNDEKLNPMLRGQAVSALQRLPKK